LTKLTFYGGVGEIGGNKILLEDQDTRLLLDFGMSFGQSGKYFSEFHQPRKCNALGDFYATGLLPRLEGVYRLDYLEYDGCSYEERGVDGLLLSHAHADHAQYIHFLRCDIPLYMTPESLAILKTLEETGSGSFNELTCRKRTFCTRPKKRGDGFTRVKGSAASDPREINLVESGQRFRVGDIEVTAFDVDHSLPGAASYLIHTSEGNILYTGDLRFHGYRGEDTKRMVEAVSDMGVDLMITEGTRIDSDDGDTEEYVRRESRKVVEDTDGLVAVNFPQRDADRLKTFQQVASDSGRKLVLGFKHAYMLEQLSKIGDYPGLGDPDLCFFADRKSWGLVGRDDYPENIIEQDYRTWEREYLYMDNTVNYRDVKENQGNYLFYCNFYQLNELIDIDPVPGSRFIRSLCEPFNEEMEIDEKKVMNWMELYGFGEPVQLHASGHAPGNQLVEMIETINPETLIPVHTENPQWFKNKHPNTKQVKLNATIII
jgi:ribonuclease J